MLFLQGTRRGAIDLKRQLVRHTSSADVHEGAYQSGDRSESSAKRVLFCVGVVNEQDGQRM
jgi:hypothetical protein